MIGDSAFQGCDWLVTAVLPQSCAVIQENAFNDCPHLSIVVAPQALEVHVWDDDTEEYVEGGSIADVFANCPLLPPPPECITPHAPGAVLAARRLEYWTWTTHALCHPARREWVRFVLLVLNRLRLPRVVQLLILGQLKRHELGRQC